MAPIHQQVESPEAYSCLARHGRRPEHRPTRHQQLQRLALQLTGTRRYNLASAIGSIQYYWLDYSLHWWTYRRSTRPKEVNG